MLDSDVPKVQKKKTVEAKQDDVISPQNYNVNKFSHRKFWCSQNATNQQNLKVELSYMCPFVLQKLHSPSSWNIKRDFYSDAIMVIFNVLR